MQKNFDSIPEICHHLDKAGVKVHWYIIGSGPDDELIRNKIKYFKMEKSVSLLGQKVNPYPYIREADIYVQPSRYEGKAVTVREAQILNKPVVIANFSTSSSQLTNGVTGVIAPLECDLLALELKSLIENERFRDELASNCAKGSFDNQAEVEKIYKYLK